MDPSKQTLLLVDDDPNIRLLARHGLVRAGYNVIEASDGQEAISIFQRQRPDLMLVDVKMPKLDGFDTVAAIRERDDGEAIPILMLTGSDDSASITRAFDVGANDFIVKPINLPILLQRCRYALVSAERDRTFRRIHIEQQSACNLAKLGFWRLRIETGALEWSQGATALLGRSTQMPASIEQLLEEIAPSQRLRTRKTFTQAAAGNGRLELELQLSRDGHECIIKLQSSAQVDAGVLIGAFQDVTALRAFEDQALYLVEHDELTGLPKQKLFTRLLQERLARSEKQAAPLMVLVVDIDRLHRINDAFGVDKGDEVMLAVAGRLRQAVPDNSLLCRLESDSFALAVSCELSRVDELQAQLECQLAPSIGIDGREIFVGTSIGVAVYPGDGGDAAALIQAAQAAERETNQEKKGKFVLYSDIRDAVQEGRVIIEADLRHALEKGEYVLFYQPQQNLSDNSIVGVEALLRWDHPERGILPPSEYIPILEETGLIHDVGDWILEAAFRQCGRWQEQRRALRVSINLAAAQVEDASLVDRLLALKEQYRIQPGRIELEITETTAMQRPEKTLLNLQKFKESGFRIAIDDFGTGHSSLAYLLNFPLDTLKIDRTFVKDITRGKRNRAIITALTTLSFHLGLTTIAEGVETESQRDYMDALNVDEIQGFLLSRPVPVEQLEAFLEGRDGASKTRL